MDPMQLAQMKRTTEWHAQEVRHMERDLQSAELALEGAKKNMDILKKKVVEGKRKLDQMNQDVLQAEKEVRQKLAEDRRL